MGDFERKMLYGLLMMMMMMMCQVWGKGFLLGIWGFSIFFWGGDGVGLGSRFLGFLFWLEKLLLLIIIDVLFLVTCCELCELEFGFHLRN